MLEPQSRSWKKTVPHKLKSHWSLSINPNWHELRKQEKCSSLVQPRSKFYKTRPERIYNPITAMGVSAMLTFQLDNTKG